MNPLKRSPLYSSVFALVVTAIALLIAVFLRPYLQSEALLLFIFTIWLSAWYHGHTGGLVASGGATAALVYYFFVSGLYTDSGARAVARVLSFLVVALLLTRSE